MDKHYVKKLVWNIMVKMKFRILLQANVTIVKETVIC